MEHSFDVDIATEFGIPSAILLNNFAYWIWKNENNNVNFYDGTYWTYNSVSAYSQMFPYLSSKQIRTAIQNLVDNGVLKTGNYNKSAYDRTLWYALTDYGKSILPKSRIHLPPRENGDVPQGKPIPYINSNIKADINKESICISDDIQYTKEKLPFNEIIDYLNAKTGKHYRPNTSKYQSLIRARFKEKYTLEDFKKVIDTKCSDWIGTDMEQYLTPDTLFSPKFDKYLNQTPKKQSFQNSPQFNPNALRRDNGVPLDELFV